jgi:hypothetical protein
MESTTATWPLTLNEMARSLGVPARWLRAEAEAGRIPGLRADTTWLFDADLVERLLLERGPTEEERRRTLAIEQARLFEELALLCGGGDRADSSPEATADEQPTRSF